MLRRTIMTAFLMALTGCSIIPERPPRKLYTLSADNSNAGISAPPKRVGAVKVNPPMVANPYDTSRIYILGKEDRLFNTDINRLAANSGQLIGSVLRERLEKEGPWSSVLLPNSIGLFEYQLTTYIPAFYISAQEKPYEAVITIQAAVTRASNNKTVFRNTFTAKAPLKEENMASVVNALQRALNQCISDLISALNHSLAKN